MTSEGFGLRHAVEADLDFLVALRRSTMWVHFEASGLPVDEAEQLGRVLHRLDCAEMVVIDGQDAGLLKVTRDTDPWELVQIQLLPSYQGRGLGEKLVGRVLDEARSSGMSVVLDVLHKNPARRLYERLGFRVVGVGHGFYFMRWDA